MKILVIHSGGTIGMVATPKGFEPRSGVVEDVIGSMHLDASVEIHSLAPLIDSANATPDDWDRISTAIATHYEEFDGFLVTHGTDTLAYTAAALSFALEGLSKPVILTGAMLPLSVDNSDGLQNLRDAFDALRTAPPGVWVQFAGRLLHGARVRKTHSHAFDAFNGDSSDVPPCRQGTIFHLHRSAEKKVMVLGFAPGVPAEIFAYAAQSCDGLVLRCYGSGTAPGSEEMRAALGRARDIPVLAVSQCPEGGLALGTYAAAEVLLENGVIDGRDMTVEAAYTKMHYALAMNADQADRRRWLELSICGELTPEV